MKGVVLGGKAARNESALTGEVSGRALTGLALTVIGLVLTEKTFRLTVKVLWLTLESLALTGRMILLA